MEFCGAGEGVGGVVEVGGVGDGERVGVVSGGWRDVAVLFCWGCAYRDALTREERAAGFASGSSDGTRNLCSGEVPSFAGRG